MTRFLLQAAVLGGALLVSAPAWAYVGPGAGLTALGSLVALLGAIGLALVGFIWYPVKRLRRKFKTARGNPADPATR